MSDDYDGYDPLGWWDEVFPGLNRPEPPDNDSNDRRFVCVNCKVELQLLYVKSIERIWNDIGGAHLRVVHQCPCRAWARDAKYPYDDAALRRLFDGHMPHLPWPRVFGKPEEGEVVDNTTTPPVESPDDRRERELERWRFDLEGVETAQDFLNFCRGPRSLDEVVRAEFRAHWPT